MGKLKISKAKKNKKANGSSGIPNWLLSALVILVVLAVLATCVGTFVASSGVTMRWSTAMSLDDLKVDGNMMSYFYQTTYMEFMNNYSSYLSYLSFDQYTDPKEQQFNPEGSYDAAFLGAFEGTWFDYFMNQTTTSVKNLLIYCAEAEKLGITLDDADNAEIDASIETLLINIRSSYGAGLSDATCFANVYGNGVSRKDVRKAMALSALASKTAEHIGKEIEDSITDDRINSVYDAEKLEFNLVNYASLAFDVYYDDVIAEKYGDEKKAETLTDAEKAEVLALYKEKIEAARASAAELATKTNFDDFRTWVVEYTVKDIYADAFDTAMEKVTSEQKPSEAELATIKEKMIAAVIADIANGKTSATDDVVTTDVAATEGAAATKAYTLYDISVKAEFAEAAKTLKTSLFDKTNTAKKNCLNEKVNYIAPDKDGNKDEFSEWAFSADRKANEVKTIEEGDGANATELKVEKENFTVTVNLLTKTSYRDETLSRDLAYMLFTKEDAAKKAIEALDAIEGLDKDKFLNVAKDENNPAAASADLKDCVIGTMQSEAFDEWLFAAKANEYTKTPITMSDGSGSLMVAMYLNEGTTPAWKHTVKSHIYNEDYTAYEERMNEDFASSVVTNEKVVNKVGN